MESGVFYSRKDVLNLPKKICIIIIRYNSNGELMCSKPCKDCIELLKLIGVDRVYYSTDQHKIACVKIQNLYSEHISWGYRFILNRNVPI
jgi:hypothetical protein